MRFNARFTKQLFGTYLNIERLGEAVANTPEPPADSPYFGVWHLAKEVTDCIEDLRQRNAFPGLNEELQSMVTASYPGRPWFGCLLDAPVLADAVQRRVKRTGESWQDLVLELPRIAQAGVTAEMQRREQGSHG